MNRLRNWRLKANIFVPFVPKSRRRGWAGRLFEGLERVGPVTRSSPLRRMVQLVCLAVFLDAFFRVCWPYAEHFGATTFSDKETLPVDLFLLLDPLVGLSTALAGRFLNLATLWWLAAIVVACLIIPRAFCGYLCPLGTLIDAFDWLVGRHLRQFHLTDTIRKRRWSHMKYYLLVGVLAASLAGTLASGFCAAIPVLTRGLLFTAGRLQLAVLKGSNHLAPVGWTFYLSVTLFAAVFLMSVFGRRFWCRYLCPSGALLSVLNPFRLAERKVEATCIECNQCVTICPFDAIQEDFTTRITDCTFCQTCGGVCPTRSIKFVSRWNRKRLISTTDSSKDAAEGRPFSRRTFVVSAGVGAAFAAFCHGERDHGHTANRRPIRPPGSVPEGRFLDLCIRCGQCLKVCPGPVLHAAGWEYGLEALWTPVVRPEHAGCHQDCNFCTQVCPTGAIQPLALEVKRTVHIGLAQVNTDTCLPYRADGRQDCDLCFQECEQAGYGAIQMRPISIPMDPPPPEGMFSELELEEMSRIEAPIVDAGKCVGCGICQYRCHMRHVVQEGRLEQSAIVVSAQNEHRLLDFP